MNGWQAIETAPKDGSNVLLCRAVDADGLPILDDAWGIFVQVAAWWGDDWMVYCSIPNEPFLHFDPTHWMPLPPNPLADPSHSTDPSTTSGSTEA
jgi:hypothetical protein